MAKQKMVVVSVPEKRWLSWCFRVLPGFDVESMRELLTAAGFAAQHISPLPPERNVKGPALFLAVAVK